jgi:hypothetical protein
MRSSLRDVYEQLKLFLSSFAEVVKTVAKRIVQFFRENWKMIKEKAIELYGFKEDMEIAKRNHQKLNFSRPRIRHQVIERKPRHLIRKVIH